MVVMLSIGRPPVILVIVPVRGLGIAVVLSLAGGLVLFALALEPAMLKVHSHVNQGCR